MEQKELLCYGVAMCDLIAGGYTMFVADALTRIQLLQGMGLISFVGVATYCIIMGLIQHKEIKI